MGATTGGEGYTIDDEHQIWIQIGAKNVTEYHVNGFSEAYYQLKQAGRYITGLL